MVIDRRSFLSKSAALSTTAWMTPWSIFGGCGIDLTTNSNTESEPKIDINYKNENNYIITLPDGQTTKSLDEFPKLLEDSLRDVDVEAVKDCLVALNTEIPSEVGLKGNEATKVTNVIEPLPDGLLFRYNLLPHYHPLCKPINENKAVEHYNFALLELPRFSG